MLRAGNCRLFDMPSDMLVFQNGGMVDSSVVPLEYWDKPGIAVFESMRVYDGVIFKLEEHLDRLFESMKSVGFQMRFDRGYFREELFHALEKSDYRSAFLRLTVAEKQNWVFVGPIKPPKAILYKKGVLLSTATMRKAGPRVSPAQAKASEYLGAVLSKAESGLGKRRRNKIHETLFLSQQGEVEECRTCNILMVKRDALVTPSGQGILDGVTRRTVIELARASGILVLERVIARHDLFNAEEAFLTYTSAEILPVREVDGRKIGFACPGRWTRLLQVEYRHLVEEYVKLNK